MLIRNNKNKLDLEAKRAMALKLLELEASNEAYLDKKVSEYRNPYKAPEVPPQYKDASEIAKDFFGNEMRLIELMVSWGFTNQVATTVVKNITASGNGNEKILKLLQAGANFKRKLDSYDKKLLSPEFISNIVERFLSNYDKTLGGSMEDTLEYVVSNLYTAKKVFPSREQIETLKSKFLKIKELRLSDPNSIDKSIDSLNKYLSILPTIESYINQIGTVPTDARAKEIEALFSEGNIPVSSNIQSYTNILSNIISNAESNIPSSRADIFNTIQNISDNINIYSTPEALASFNVLRENLKLPPNANMTEVLDASTNKIKEQKHTIEVQKEQLSESQKMNLRTMMIRADNIREGKSNYNAEDAKIVFEDPKLTTNRTTKNPLVIVPDYYIKKIDSGKFTTIEQIQEDYQNKKLRYYRIPEEVPYEEGGRKISSAKSQNKIKTGSLTQTSTPTFANKDTEEEKNELKVDIEIIETLNPGAVKKSVESLNKITNEPTDYFLELDKLVDKGFDKLSKIDSIENFNIENKKFQDEIIDFLNSVPQREKNNVVNFYERTYKNEIGTRVNLYKDLLELNTPESLGPRYSKGIKFKTISESEINVNEEFDNFYEVYGSLLPTERRKIVEKYAPKLIEGRILPSKKNDLLKLYNKMATANYVTGEFTDEYKDKKKNNKGNVIKYDFKGLGFAHKKIKVGRGLELEPEPKYINFGKYLLNKSHLYNDSKLTLRFPSGGAIPTIKPTNITEDFREFLIDLIENEKISQPLYKSVPQNEKIFFGKICKGAGIVHKLGIKPESDESDAKDLSRYKLLLGELEAGNNNKQMIRELKGLILKFMENGRMRKNQGQQLLLEISEL